MADTSKDNRPDLKEAAMESSSTSQARQHSPTTPPSQPRTKRARVESDASESSVDSVPGLETTSVAQEVDSEHEEEDNEEYDSEDDEDDEFGEGEAPNDQLRELFRMFGLPTSGFGEFEDEDEEEEPQDYDVEEIDYVIPGDGRVVKMRVAVCKERGAPYENWLEDIHVRCTLDGQMIARGFGRYIRRDAITANFWRDMEEPSKDMADLAFSLFDRYGSLLPKYKEHCVQRGTGAWGEELDDGPLFLIEETIVTERDLRRKGLGGAITKALLQKAETKAKPKPRTAEEIQLDQIFHPNEDFTKYHTLHAIVIPGWLRSDVEPLSKDKSGDERRVIRATAHDEAVVFYRALGFRRIGASDCLGFSFDPAHKSRAIKVAADFDPAEIKLSDLTSGDDDVQERLDRTFPHHKATASMTDKESVAYYQKILDRGDFNWKQGNHLRNNLLHIAAMAQKPESVKWLMENVNNGASLSTARNIRGYTPLEGLQIALEEFRTRREVHGGNLRVDISHRFVGFSSDAVDCMALLMGLNPQIMSKSQRQRLAFGCTCGECLDGFMSPRMVAALVYQAETTYDILDMDIGDGPSWCESFNYMFAYVAPDLRQNFRTNKSYRQGFKNVFGLIADCLRSKVLPVRDNILQRHLHTSEWPPVTRSYLNRGGTVEGKIEPALRIAFQHAEEQGERTGDGNYEEVIGYAASQSEVPIPEAALKKCRNDNEYGFVEVQCGLPTRDYY